MKMVAALPLQKMGAQAVQNEIVQAPTHERGRPVKEAGGFEHLFQTALQRMEQEPNRPQEGWEIPELREPVLEAQRHDASPLVSVGCQLVGQDWSGQDAIVQAESTRSLDVAAQMGENLSMRAQGEGALEFISIPIEPAHVPDATIAGPTIEDVVFSGGSVPSVVDALSPDSFPLLAGQWECADEFVSVLEPKDEWNPVKLVPPDGQVKPQAPPAATPAATEVTMQESNAAVLMDLFGSHRDGLHGQEPLLMDGPWNEKHLEMLTHNRAAVVPTALLEGVSERISSQQTLPAMTHVSRAGYEPLFDTIVQSVRLAQNGETTEMQVRLKPEFLGRLSIRVSSDEHGLNIEIKAENAVVRQVMQENMADLQQRLTEKGVAFHQLSILADTDSGRRKEPAWLSSPSPSHAEGETEIGPETVVATALGIRNTVIDYLA